MAYNSRLLLFRRCATLLSAIGFVAISACWLRSFWPLEIEYDKGYSSLGAMLYQGNLVIEYRDFRNPHPARGYSYRSHKFVGVATNLIPMWYPFRPGWRLGIPLVYPAILLAIMPLLWLLPFHRRYVRRLRNQCVHCAYSLRGNTTGICPECGDAIFKTPQ